MKTEEKYAQLLYGVSHDLKAPIRHIKSFYHILMEELEEDLDAPLNEEQQQYRKFIEQSIETAERQLDRLTILSRIYSREYRAETLAINDLLTEVIADVKNELQKEVDIDIDCPNELSIRCPRALLIICLYEAIKNAFVYCDAESPHVQIKVSDNTSDNISTIDDKKSCSHQDWIYIAIKDNGGSVDTEHFQQCLKPFRRLHDDKNKSATGLGLFIALNAAEKLGGMIDLGRAMDLCNATNSSEENDMAVIYKFPKSPPTEQE